MASTKTVSVMKALETIGFAKAFRFVWTGLYAAILHICFFPQLRGLLMGIVGVSIGDDSIIYNVSFANLYHYGFIRLTIGKKCFIADNVMLDMRGGITLEDSVTVSEQAAILTHINVGYPDHPLQKFYPTKEARVTLKKGCYVATGAIILPGVTVGEMAVVAAGAVVTHDVASKTVVAGVPAKVIKKIS